MNFKRYFKDFIEIMEMDKSKLNIVLIAHVREPRGFVNNSQIQCTDTERFSIDEFHTIYQGIVDAGFFIQAIYYNELDFIKDYTNNSEKFSNSLLYNLSRNGLGNNKKTLIPAFCELVNLPYSTSSSFSTALCRNKYIFSELLEKHNILTPKSWLQFKDGTWLNNKYPTKGTLVIRKPDSDSASQGINEDSIFEFDITKAQYNNLNDWLYQEYIDGEECEVAIFSSKNKTISLPPIGIQLPNIHILSYELSYNDDYNFYMLSDTQPQSVIDKVQLEAIRAYKLLSLEVYGRIDFRIDKNGNCYIFDIATTPYTTLHSSFSYAFKLLGFKYSHIYDLIISLAMHRNKDYSDKNCRSDNNNPLP